METVGFSPKFFSRLVRFQSLFKFVHLRASHNLTTVAIECGYYDQSHLIRDFKEFTGVSPAFYLSESHLISDFFTAQDSISYLYNS